VSPDPRYLFFTRHAQEALDCLTYGIQSRKGFILLTGEVGTGKTTLINKLLELLRVQQVATAFIFNSRLDVPQFLNYMMSDFGIPCDSKSKSQVLILFYNWLLDRYRAGETAVLIVDEAQNLSEELLEEIRMMTNVESLTEKLLQIVLVGQPELEQIIKQPQLRQLRQRITLRARTYPLSLGETKLYVNQRLRIAGSNGEQIFSPESLAAIYRYSNGIPRVVNLICEQCLVGAFVDQQRVVKVSVVDAVARDFDLGDGNLPGSAPLASVAPGGKIMASPAPPAPSTKIRPPSSSAAPGSKSDLTEVLKTLTDLADRLRESEPKLPKKRKKEPNS
jgi:type II secretory pathway predicted ATPase ExeA